jgi:hypothetical protein
MASGWVENDMQTIKLVIVFILVAVVLLAIFGTADLKSQARYAAKMDAPRLMAKSTAKTGVVAHQKGKNQNL